ncbi:hypothetical protein SESBI_03846 [Sesbania bispinosa]|nr:hypothetical protein SESBI_03846 [Sesbania bispinosa]
MGRPKLTLKCIPNERERNLAFMKRKKGLLKKMSEFSSMCGVDACLIIYYGNGHAPTVTWPQNPTELYSIIQKYELAKNEKPPKNFDLQDFFQIRKNLVESETSKVRKGILKIEYPTWHPSLNSLGEGELRSFIAMLDTKLEACNLRINMLKNKHPFEEANFIFMPNISQSQHLIDSMKPLNDGTNQLGNSINQLDVPMLMPKNNGIVDITNQVDLPVDCSNQIVAFGNSTNQIDGPVLVNNDMVDITDLVDFPVDCTNQIVAFGNSINQISGPVLMANNDGMVDITNHVDVSVNYRNQIGAFGNSTNQLDVPVDWTGSQLSEVVDWTDPANWTNQLGVPSDTTMNGSSNYGTNFHVLELEKDGIKDKPNSSSICNYNGGQPLMQPYNFDPTLQNISSQSENVQQEAALHTLPSPVDEFHTDDYNNKLQAQFFNHIN